MNTAIIKNAAPESITLWTPVSPVFKILTLTSAF
jgi:hypothetical protein